MVQMIATRDGYGKALVELGQKNHEVVVLDADLAKSTKSIEFGKKFPERFWYTGISEADTIGMAAGLATCGKVAFASSFAVFITNRCYDQIRMSVAYSNTNVKIVGSHGGLLTGADGPSAQAILDVALMRTMPNMVVTVAADFVEAQKITHAVAEHKGPCYLRTTREPRPVIFDDSYEFRIGKGAVVVEGNDVSLIACGPILNEAIQASAVLKKQGISASVVNMPSIKPLDEKLVVQQAKKTGRVLTIEDHVINGGLGSAVAEALGEHFPARMQRVGVQNVFAESGSPKELYGKYGLDAEAIVKKAKNLLRE